MTTLGALAAVGLTVGALAAAPAAPPTSAPAATPAAPAAPPVTMTLAAAHSELAALEQQADAAGVAAERADEALLAHRTPATVAAAQRARQALQALAAEQQPQLRTVAAVLGTAAVAGPAVTTAVTVSATHRTRALKAVAFAARQLGKPYAYAADGMRAYDCSGLTMRAYESVDRSIGGHSAMAQYLRAKRQHRLHAYGHARPGDLIFYGSAYSVYHVAIYVGHGRMIEAPYPGKPVREVAVRPWGRLGQVARPTS